jgi:hypothetical protein
LAAAATVAIATLASTADGAQSARTVVDQDVCSNVVSRRR